MTIKDVIYAVRECESTIRLAFDDLLGSVERNYRDLDEDGSLVSNFVNANRAYQNLDKALDQINSINRISSLGAFSIVQHNCDRQTSDGGFGDKVLLTIPVVGGNTFNKGEYEKLVVDIINRFSRSIQKYYYADKPVIFKIEYRKNTYFSILAVSRTGNTQEERGMSFLFSVQFSRMSEDAGDIVPLRSASRLSREKTETMIADLITSQEAELKKERNLRSSQLGRKFKMSFGDFDFIEER